MKPNEEKDGEIVLSGRKSLLETTTNVWLYLCCQKNIQLSQLENRSRWKFDLPFWAQRSANVDGAPHTKELWICRWFCKVSHSWQLFEMTDRVGFHSVQFFTSVEFCFFYSWASGGDKKPRRHRGLLCNPRWLRLLEGRRQLADYINKLRRLVKDRNEWEGSQVERNAGDWER